MDRGLAGNGPEQRQVKVRPVRQRMGDIEAMGATARARVLRRFTWNRAFQAQTAAYASLVGAPRIRVPEHQVIGLRSPTS